MATLEINKNCHYEKIDSHRCKIKLEKFHFDILRCYGVIKESLPPGGGRGVLPPRRDRVKGNTLEIPNEFRFIKNILIYKRFSRNGCI